MRRGRGVAAPMADMRAQPLVPEADIDGVPALLAPGRTETDDVGELLHVAKRIEGGGHRSAGRHRETTKKPRSVGEGAAPRCAQSTDVDRVENHARLAELLL